MPEKVISLAEQRPEKPILKISPAPSFWAEVNITEPGGAPTAIEVQFRVMDQARVDSIFKDLVSGSYTRLELLCGAEATEERAGIPPLITGWRGVEVEFSRDAVAKLLLARTKFFDDITAGYGLAYGKARAGN